ncbi:hypothetical protein MNBD_GAMMA12-1367 [hydrothermal vent metagenome]|uniref:TNase-like domain-containing protein n=1 Tax=hydrothermal vent metagenome TaxID=652676 RepID=A0A3B0YKG4_9ZZZZ
MSTITAKTLLHNLTFLIFSCLNISLYAATQPSICLLGKQSFFDAKVQKVIDGDTLLIKRIQPTPSSNKEEVIRVRLIGINTPERKNRQFPTQAYYHSALRSLRELIRKRHFKVKVVARKKDRHGRLLAHIFTDSGQNVQYHLLKQGLAFNLPWPPNLSYQACYRLAETLAIKSRLKIWQHPYYQPIMMEDLDSATIPAPKMNRNFRRIQGTVSSIGQSQNSRWINFTSKKGSVRIAEDDLRYFKPSIQQFRGKTIIITGYLLPKRSRSQSAPSFFMRIRHPHQIRTLNLQTTIGEDK